MDTQELRLRSNHQEFINPFVNACFTDERVVASFLGGSYAKGSADEYSDVDLCIVTTDAAHLEFYFQREAFLRHLGEPVFLEDFEIPNIAFFIFSDGTEGELNFGSEGHLDDIQSGLFQVLLDKTNVLAGAVFSEPETDPSKQAENLRRQIHWFWHELSHIITAIGRRQLWWAYGQLEAMRSICVTIFQTDNSSILRGDSSVTGAITWDPVSTKAGKSDDRAAGETFPLKPQPRTPLVLRFQL